MIDDNNPKAAPFRTLYVELGAALHVWQLVEINMSLLFIQLLGVNNWIVGGIVFHRLGNSKSKLLAINELVNYLIRDQPTLDLWKDAHKAINKCIDYRNKIVHSMFLPQGDQEQFDLTIRPFPTEYKHRNKPSYSASDITEWRKSFNDALIKLENAYDQICKQRPLPETSPE